jgi:hypothetical protein
VLGEIEKQLFELLPDQFQGPLEKILGGNPFDSQLDRDASGQEDQDGGFVDGIKSKLLNKIRALVEKVQEALRESILGVVNGGHRKLERESWVFVQTMVEQKVQKYLPDVQIEVPDDIGNENVSVGEPTSGTQMGGGAQPPRRNDEGSMRAPYSDPQMGEGHQPPPTRNEYYQDSQQGQYEPDPRTQMGGGYQPPPREDDYSSRSGYDDYRR